MLFYWRWKLLSPNEAFTSEADFTIEKLSPYLVMGSPSECIQQLEMWKEVVGADYIIMRFRLPLGPAPERVIACIRQFGAEVIPHFKPHFK